MNTIARRGISYMKSKGKAALSSPANVTAGQDTLLQTAVQEIRDRCKLKGDILRNLGGAVATSTMLGLPLGHHSSAHEGPKYAPPLIREGLWDISTNSTTEEGKDISDPRVLSDVGDVPIQELHEAQIDDDRLMQCITDCVKEVMDVSPMRPLVLGGDHSISFPVVRAVSEKLGGPVDILHIDAHPDLYEAFMGDPYSHASPFARIMENGYCRRLVQVGIRSINSEGRQQAQRYGVQQIEMRNYEEHREELENLTLGEGVRGVYVSIDCDGMDPAFAPGVSHREPGGLSFRDVMNIVQNLKGDIVGADVVEFNPQLDPAEGQGLTMFVAAKVVREVAAKMSK
ncbi:Arginase 1- mitochondrial [Striga hermonthica]|uniref:arginase n=1 Tax=Striga hermonthica TaxID=68872 RepID=A0A9N7MI13_STRHE|nr:Arginase 1- mitochondrial [Striga hermonthica]